MKKIVVLFIVFFIGSIGLMGCGGGGGGGGGTAEAQVPTLGGGFKIPGAPRIVEGLKAGIDGLGGCFVDGDIEVINNVFIFQISGGTTPTCQQYLGVEFVVPTPYVSGSTSASESYFAFRSR
jgi:hypothetical protein